MTDVPQYRSAVQDALGRVIPDEGPLRLWLDDDVVDREAPEGWLHLISAREICFLLLTGRVVELSLDNDLSNDRVYGNGTQVIDFIDHYAGEYGRALWPEDGITVHTANPNARDAMRKAILAAAPRHVDVHETRTASGKPRFDFTAREPSV